jgi:hypothetical protein
MKKYAYIVAALSLALWVASSFASPQIQNQIKVNVPFTFYVGNTQLPAGEYTIRRVSDATPDVLELRSTDGRMAVLVLGRPTQSTTTPSKTELVFKKYGNVPILSQIFQAGNQWGSRTSKIAPGRAGSKRWYNARDAISRRDQQQTESGPEPVKRHRLLAQW